MHNENCTSPVVGKLHSFLGLCRNLGKKVGFEKEENVHDKALLDRDGTAALVGKKVRFLFGIEIGEGQ